MSIPSGGRLLTGVCPKGVSCFISRASKVSSRRNIERAAINAAPALAASKTEALYLPVVRCLEREVT